jgi:uncharacterized iron-regulated membrane protein
MLHDRLSTSGEKISAWQGWLHHPEGMWIRKAFFHVHLWVGTAVGLYVILMSVTGSLIVYRNELEKMPSMVSSLKWIIDLHENLLFGQAGRSVNGIGGFCVIVLCLTGAVIWWPGITSWRRALAVNWSSHLGRLSWDLHSALGFWCFLFVLMWAISGVYFSFPQIFNALFGVFDPGDKFTDDMLLRFSNLHFGRFNWFSEALWVLLGLVPAVLAVTGVFLCCRRMIYGALQPHEAKPGE